MAASSHAGEYDVVKQLGAGAFGSVTKVVRRSDRKAFAMKTVQIGRMEEREVAWFQSNSWIRSRVTLSFLQYQVADALNECRILASVRHPRIVNFEVLVTVRYPLPSFDIRPFHFSSTILFTYRSAGCLSREEWTGAMFGYGAV